MCFETCLSDPRHFYRCTLCRCYFSLDSLPQTSALSGCGEQKLSHPSSHRVEVRWSHKNKEMSKNIYSMNWYTRLCMSLWFSGLSKYPKNKDLTVQHHIKLTGRPTDWLADRLYDRLSDCPIDRLSDWLIDRLPDLPIDWLTDRLIERLTDWLIDWLTNCLIDFMDDHLSDQKKSIYYWVLCRLDTFRWTWNERYYRVRVICFIFRYYTRKRH